MRLLLTQYETILRKNSESRYQPCLCLCLGFSQITLMLPFLLMILHFSQIGFTEDLTFILFLSFREIIATFTIFSQICEKVRIVLYYRTFNNASVFLFYIKYLFTLYVRVNSTLLFFLMKKIFSS